MKIGSRTLVDTLELLEEVEEVAVLRGLSSSAPSPLVRFESALEVPRPSAPAADPEADPVESPAADPLEPSPAADPVLAPVAPLCLAKASWTAWLSWALLIVGVAAAPADAVSAGAWPAKRVRSRVASSRLWGIRSIESKGVGRSENSAWARARERLW